MDYSPPGPSVHGIFQARILEQVAISFSMGSSWLRIESMFLVSPALVGRFITTSATWEAQDSGRGYQNCGNTMRKGLWETIQESVHCIREHASSFISSLFYISIFSPLNRKNMLKFLAVVGNIKKKSAPGSPTTSKSCWLYFSWTTKLSRGLFSFSEETSTQTSPLLVNISLNFCTEV